jgi:hypothetical protein
MKKILYTIFVSFIAFIAMPTFTAKAQGNLQFNQVISASFNLGSNANSTTLTVPVGKVWKIESMGCNNYTPQNISYVINAIAFSVIPGYQKDAGSTIWLKAGDTFYLRNLVNYASGVYYSILEFNIVP